MKPSEVLSDESKWCQWASARGKSGRRVTPYGRSAVKWCLLGAIDRAFGENEIRRVDFANSVFRLLGCNIADWNDSPVRKFEQVRDVLLRAERIQEIAGGTE